MSNQYFGQTGFLNLGGLTQHELNQISNLGSVTISPQTWSYLSSINQSLGTSSSPTFTNLTAGTIRANTSFILGSGAFKTTISTMILGSDTTLTLPTYDQSLYVPIFAYINTTNGTSQHHIMKTNNKFRWAMELIDADPDDESTTGSNLMFRRYDDVGVSLGETLKIDRATGYVGINLLTTVSPTEALEVNGNVKASGTLTLNSLPVYGRTVGTFNASFIGPFVGSITSPMTYHIEGNKVTLYTALKNANNSNSGATISTDVAIPAAIRPPANIVFFTHILEGFIWKMGQILIQSNGTMLIGNMGVVNSYEIGGYAAVGNFVGFGAMTLSWLI